MPPLGASDVFLSLCLPSQLQQRAVEYKGLPTLNRELVAGVLDAMPAYPERDNILEVRLEKSKVAAKVCLPCSPARLL